MRTLYAKIRETDQYDAYSEILVEILSQESLSDDDRFLHLGKDVELLTDKRRIRPIPN